MTKNELVNVIAELTEELQEIESFTVEENIALRPLELKSIRRKIAIGLKAIRNVEGV